MGGTGGRESGLAELQAPGIETYSYVQINLRKVVKQGGTDFTYW